MKDHVVIIVYFLMGVVARTV